MEKMTLRQQLLEFHRAAGAPVAATPRIPEDDRVRLRMRLIADEFFGVLDAFYGKNGETAFARRLVDDLVLSCKLRTDLVKIADGFADLDYAVESARLEFGIDGAPIAALVHAANMAESEGALRSDGSVRPIRQWAPPDIQSELERQAAQSDGH